MQTQTRTQKTSGPYTSNGLPPRPTLRFAAVNSPMTSTPKSKIAALSAQTPYLPGHYTSSTPFISKTKTSLKAIAQQDASFRPSPKTPKWPGEYKSVVLTNSLRKEPEQSTSTSHLRRSSVEKSNARILPDAIAEEEDESLNLSASLSRIRLQHSPGRTIEREMDDASLPESIQPSVEEDVLELESPELDVPPNRLVLSNPSENV